ncbi:hypothetical protein [Mycobacterium sp.]
MRTVLIGADLVTQHGEPLQHTVSQAVLIHTSDTLTAAAVGTSENCGPR